MKHSLQVATIVIGLLGFGREARAQWSYCNSGTAYNGTCYEGTSTSGWTAGNAVIGADTSSGNGVWGQSQTGIGVIGSSDTTDSAPTLKIGVFGEANSSSGAAVYAHNVSTSTGTNDWGVYGLSDNGWGGYFQTSGGTGYGGLFAGAGNNGEWAAYLAGNIQVTGTPYCSGCTAFTNNSDIRLKKNVQPLAGALDRLLQLRGVTFEWKDPSEHGNHVGPQRGFIAQEVEKVIPEWVGVDGKGFKTLNLTGMEPMVVESLRTLKAENDELRDRVKALEAGSRPRTAGLGEGGVGVGLGLLLALGAYAVSRRRLASRTAA